MTDSWLDELNRRKELRVKFYLRYPRACRTCDAAGGKLDDGDYWIPPSWDTCPDCSQLDKCPRCMLQFAGDAVEDFAEGIDCPMCGYSHSTSYDGWPPEEE